MSSEESMTAKSDDPVAQSSSKRWATDFSGCTVYYPFGQTRGGYLVSEAALESAIREVDQRFKDRSDRLLPYVSLLGVPLSYVVYYFFRTHPVLVIAVFPATILLLVMVAERFRRSALAPLLDRLATVPPADPNGQNRLHIAGYVILALIGLIYLVLYLYGLRVATAEVDSRATDFYRDISQYLVFGSLSALSLWAVIAGWSRVVAKTGSNRAMLSVFVLGVLSLGFFFAAAWNFYDPRPAVVLSHDSLYCQWRVRWSDIANLTLRSGRRFQEYARIEFVANRSPFSDGRSSESCKIDGLNTDYAEVYEAMQKSWQAALQDKATANGMIGKPTADSRSVPTR
jgi:hypothetical protein